MNKVVKTIRPSKFMTWLRGHKRAISEGIKLPIETPISTLLTIVTLAICFYLPLILWLLWHNFSEIEKQWQQKGSIAVFVNETVDTNQLQLLQQELQEKKLIQSSAIIYKQDIKKQLKTDPQLANILGIIEEQSLPNQILLTPVPEATEKQLMRFINSLIVNPYIEYVSFDAEWFSQLKNLTLTFYYLMQTSIIVFLIIVLVILIHTIGNEVANHQKEIKLTQLLGATNPQIRRRFLYSGIYYGVAAGLLSLLFLYVSLWWVKKPIESLASNFSDFININSLNMDKALIFLCLTIFITWLGSRLALAHKLSRI